MLVAHDGGLLKMLQRHAKTLVSGYENKTAYLAAFTNAVAPIGNAKPLLTLLSR